MTLTPARNKKRIRGWWRTLRIVALAVIALSMLAWIAALAAILAGSGYASVSHAAEVPQGGPAFCLLIPRERG